MKNLLLFVIALLMSGIAFAGDGFSVKYSQSTESNRQLSFTLGEYSIENTSIDGQTYSTIVFDGQITTKQKGWAQLPFISSSIQISNLNNIDVNVENTNYIDINLDYPLLPSRGVIYRNQDPSSIAYEIDNASITDSWFPKSITTADQPYILRDVRGTNIKVFPFRYNAALNILRVYTQVDVSVIDNNSQSINPKTNVSTSILREMSAMYRSVFINYGQDSREELSNGEYGDLLVICTERDEDAIAPFIEWKKEKGFNVELEVVEVATNVKSLIQDAYDNNNDLLYVQLVGDWADIKCDLGGGANSPMDPMLGCVEGSDYYPEIAIGRFSGNSPDDITVQVNKAITYEKMPQDDAEWYGHALAIGSSQGAGSGDDGEMDKDHVQIIYDNKLEVFSYNQNYTSYDPGANSGQVTTAVEEGVSIINYCGHGSQTSWGTTGFNNSNVNSLSNGEMLPFIFSVACVNGAFHNGECFGEAWLKKDGGGAVIALMSTINQPWQPPMRGQDYFNDILTGGYDYDNNPGNGTNTEDGRSFIGSIITNGLILMYAESSGGEDLETIQTWTTFGDCSMQVRTIAPSELSLSNNVIISGVDFTTTVTSDGNPVAGAIVAISQANGELYYSAVTDENGEITIAHELMPGEAKLVVTSFNTQTIYEEVVVISPDGAYLVIDGFEMNTDDGMVYYDSEVSMDITISNLGSESVSDLTITLTTEDDDYCSLLSAITVNLGSINPDESITLEDAFMFAIGDDVPNQHNVNLSFDIMDPSDEIWQGDITFKVNAPEMDITFIEIDDTEGGNGNGRLDAGETAILTYDAINMGNANSTDAQISLNSSSEYITIVTSMIDLGIIDFETGIEASFEIVVADDAPVGAMANFSTDLVAGNYNFNHTMMLSLGLVVEDWETGDFTQFDWQFEDDADWVIIDDEDDVYEGLFSAKSGDIGDGQASTVSIDVSTPSATTVSFYIKVSSESGYDKLGFLIDGIEQENWSGEEAWTLAEFDVTEGDHTFAWTYSKDGSVNNGSDCAWIDYIILPGATSAAPLFADFIVDDQEVCDGEDASFSANCIGEVTSYVWEFEGGDPETSDEENPIINYPTPGVYSVSLTVGDGTNENTMIKEEYITVYNCTDIIDTYQLNVEIYPNPNNGIFTINTNQSAKVEVFNTIGHVVYTKNITDNETIKLDTQAEGIYFVRIETETENVVRKIIVRR